ncbi:MAG: S41 family peptidase [Treponemataceae bacterium]|nr:S41 family peptidase [Treponemataceae bacterium]
MLGLIYNRLFSQDPAPLIFALLVALSSIAILIMRRSIFSRKPLGIKPEEMRYTDCSAAFRRKRHKLYIFVCQLPFLVCFFHFVFARFINNSWATWHYYGIFYLAAFLIALQPLSDLHPVSRKIYAPLVTIFAAAAFFHTLVFPMAVSSAIRNHTHKSYTQSFVSLTEDMEKYYSLTDWKKTDIAALRDKFLPVVKKAQENDDSGLFLAVIYAYAYYFYDGHVQVFQNTEAFWRSYMLLSGNDYGFSIVRLDDGSYIAVNTDAESEAFGAGIHDGTEIRMWNKKPVEQAVDGVECIYNLTWPVKENEDFFRPVWLSTRGMNDSADIVERLITNAEAEINLRRSPACVGFITDQGEYKELELKALGPGIDRLESTTLSLLHLLKLSKYGVYDNLECKMINADTAYMLRCSESLSLYGNILSYFTGKLPGFKEELAGKLTKLREQGMRKLIIDVRGNTGGFSGMANETASLFSKESFPMDTKATFINGKFKMLTTEYVESDGSFSDIKVVVLTDSFCMSAGDYLVKAMGNCPNVTVMGMTTSNCSCQTTGGQSYLSEGICHVCYPVNWMFDQDGNRFIDTDASRECTLPLDVKIPLTKEGALIMLDKNENTADYQLYYVIEYLKDSD